MQLACLVSDGSFAAAAAKPLVAPSDDALCLLYYKTANIEPPLDSFAEASLAVRNANEFDRPKALAAEKAKLEALAASLAAVTSVRVNITMSMGQYNADQQEYDLTGFAPDQFLQFNCVDYKLQVRLRIDNAVYAQAWALDPTSAQKALAKNQGSRDVIAATTIDLTGVDPSGPNDPMVLVGNATDVLIEGEFSHVLLGRYAVAPH